MDLGEGWNHDVQGGRVVKATTTSPPNPNPPPPPVTEASEQPKVTATRKTGRPQKPEPKTTSSPGPAAGKPKKKAAASVKPAAAKPTTPNLVVQPKALPPHSRKFLISSTTFPSMHVWR